MNIRWKREEIIFETLYEADVWADSLANEIYGRIYDGYITSDYKIAYSLAFRLASIDTFRVNTQQDGLNIYKVWVTT
ncbi:hypothetical protein MPH47_16745 [Psychrobacillus psychrodurans]|jgi:hypothetical protein|uniref:hypothetical protein n=1 Tax=Psychrobacillus TaxID=1221880 RepID=UPI001F4EECE0|nr:hypothetical protein [Psychrobacillus psychrodurans]MCK1998849.1 hypothetical protein [Psychrobacillus psychrodurans]